MQIIKKILKNDTNTCDFEVTNNDRARIEENPPFKTAGAIFSMTKTTFSCRLPRPIMKPCTMCAQKSTHRPTPMIRMFMEVMSMVRPHQCMKPKKEELIFFYAFRFTDIMSKEMDRFIQRYLQLVIMNGLIHAFYS